MGTGRRTSVLTKVAQEKFWACEACHHEATELLETVLTRCGFTKREIERAAVEITCPGCEGQLGLLDYVIPYSPEQLRFHKMLARDSPRLAELDSFIRQFPTLAPLHSVGSELADAVAKAHVRILQPRKWYRCIGGKKVNLDGVFPKQPQRPYRFNHVGQTALYLADDPRTAIIEIRQEDTLKEVRAGLWIAAIEIGSPLRVLDASMPMFTDHKGQPSILQSVLTRSFLRHKKKDKSQFQPQYLLTRFVADLARRRNLDGIYYTSCHEYPYRDDVYGTNLVVFNSSYRSFISAATPTKVSWLRKDDVGMGLPSMAAEATSLVK